MDDTIKAWEDHDRHRQMIVNQIAHAETRLHRIQGIILDNRFGELANRALLSELEKANASYLDLLHDLVNHAAKEPLV